MFTKIFYVSVIVSNQDNGLEFYTKLGFEKRVDFPGREGRFLTIGLNGQDVELVLFKGTPTPFTDNAEASVNTNPGIIFMETEDLKNDFDMLVSKGVKFIDKAPETYPWGVRITTVDPDGNRIALRQRK